MGFYLILGAMLGFGAGVAFCCIVAVNFTGHDANQTEGGNDE